MTDSNQTPRDAEPSSSPVSRRNFLLATGAATAGLSTQVGRARADPARGGTIAVDGSRRHRRLSREVAEAMDRERADVEFAVLSSGTAAGFRRFASGEVDAHVASRPMVPDEREAAAENGVDYERVELALDGAALVHSERAWYDCASESRLVKAWSGEADAPAYAEVAGDGAVAPSGVAVDGEERSEPFGLRAAPSADANAVVRGRRAFQYERGYGGVGYYEPDPADVRPLAAVRREGVEPYAPLVRLAFLYLNGESLERADAQRLARTYLDRAARRTGEVTYFADPTGLGT